MDTKAPKIALNSSSKPKEKAIDLPDKTPFVLVVAAVILLIVGISFANLNGTYQPQSNGAELSEGSACLNEGILDKDSEFLYVCYRDVSTGNLKWQIKGPLGSESIKKLVEKNWGSTSTPVSNVPTQSTPTPQASEIRRISKGDEKACNIYRPAYYKAMDMPFGDPRATYILRNAYFEAMQYAEYDLKIAFQVLYDGVPGSSYSVLKVVETCL